VGVAVVVLVEVGEGCRVMVGVELGGGGVFVGIPTTIETPRVTPNICPSPSESLQ
jgi:hypothetical protein